MQTIPLLYAPASITPMGFSIGGWHPFSGGIVGDLTGGTIGGEKVLSGGLAGVASHLDQIAKGVNLSILGPSVGGELNQLVNALEARLSTWPNGWTNIKPP